MPQPERYVISATLITGSPLAIHSGLGSEDLQALGLLPKDQPFRPASAWNADKLESCDQLVIRDGYGRPYVPGSSLKGVMRDFLMRDDSDAGPAAVLDWLLGTKSQRNSESPGAEEAQGTGGAAIFEDAFLDTQGHCAGRQRYFQNLHRQWFAAVSGSEELSEQPRNYAENGPNIIASFPDDSWRARHKPGALLTDTDHLPFWDPASLTYVEHQIAVDRRSGTVGEGKSFTSEVVPAGIPFQIRWIVDHDAQLSRPATRRLLRGLAGFNLDPVHEPICLGSGSRHGWGRMVCLFSSVGVQAWSPAGFRDVAAEEIDVQAELALGLSQPPLPHKPRVQIEVELRFQGPMLVNDPAKVCVLKAVEEKIVRSGDEKEKEKKNPDHVPRVATARIESDGDGKTLILTPLIPGTGVKGPIRAQLERIMRSLDPQADVGPHGDLHPVGRKSSEFVKQLFGCESRESGLWCSEFIGRESAEPGWSKREMVAIDRFTGGASEHAKFDAIVLDRPTLQGALAVELPAAWDDASKTLGLIVLMLRDWIEGDIAFGMGDMKAFGQCVAQVRSVRVAGLSRCEKLQQRLTQVAAEHEDVHRWLDAVRDAIGDRQAAEPHASHPPVLQQADELIDEFLQTLRSSAVGKSTATGA